MTQHTAPSTAPRVLPKAIAPATRCGMNSALHEPYRIHTTDLPSRVRAGETYIDPSVRVPSLPQFASLAKELPRALRAGAPLHVRHPVLTALFLGALLAR